jgi:hypothetical protein
MICPNPDCTGEELETFEVETRYGLLGSGLWVDCPDCGASIEIEVLILEPRRSLSDINGAPTPA